MKDTQMMQKEMQKYFVVEDQVIEVILKLLYTDTLSFELFPFNLFQNLLLSHPVNEYKVLDCLMFLLKHDNLEEHRQKIEAQGFPLLKIYERNQLNSNYQYVYLQIIQKIMYLFQKFSKKCSNYFIEQDEPKKKKGLQSIESLKKLISPLNETSSSQMADLSEASPSS